LAELRFTDDNGLSGFHHAIIKGHNNLVKILLTQEPELLHMEVEDSSRNTSMHLIVHSRNLTLLKIVAEFDPDYKVENSLGDTPLHYAIMNADTSMAKMLINLGGEELTTIRNKAGQIPVQLAKETKTKMALQDHTSNSSISSFNNSVAPRFKPTQHSMQNAGYKQALSSVMRGDQLTQLVNELQGGSAQGHSVNNDAYDDNTKAKKQAKASAQSALLQPKVH